MAGNLLVFKREKDRENNKILNISQNNVDMYIRYMNDACIKYLLILCKDSFINNFIIISVFLIFVNMGVRYLKSHVEKVIGYKGTKVNISREARSSDGWCIQPSERLDVTETRGRGLVFDGDGFCYWATDAPW
jgi:hypothetical protein